nr:NAD(P)H-quinone oxidoreductase subunit 4 [Crocosphaera sp.]
LTAVGLILTPIYLLSMLRVVFYGQKNEGLRLPKFNLDAKPREVFITACLLLPIITIGLYPKLATTTYDVKTVEVASKARSALPTIAQQQETSRQNNINEELASTVFVAPEID